MKALGSAIAWSPDGSRLWFSLPSEQGQTSIHSKDPARPGDPPRVEWHAPGSFMLQDISRDGRLLVRRDDMQGGSVVFRDGITEPLDLSWLDQSNAIDIAPASGTVLINDGPGMYLRNVDGSPALHLGDSLAARCRRMGAWSSRSRDSAMRFSSFLSGPAHRGSCRRRVSSRSSPGSILMARGSGSMAGRRAAPGATTS